MDNAMQAAMGEDVALAMYRHGYVHAAAALHEHWFDHKPSHMEKLHRYWLKK